MKIWRSKNLQKHMKKYSPREKPSVPFDPKGEKAVLLLSGTDLSGSFTRVSYAHKRDGDPGHLNQLIPTIIVDEQEKTMVDGALRTVKHRPYAMTEVCVCRIMCCSNGCSVLRL